jgi:hypothetical protein
LVLLFLRTYWIKAATEKERSEWIAAIQAKLDKLREASASPPATDTARLLATTPTDGSGTLNTGRKRTGAMQTPVATTNAETISALAENLEKSRTRSLRGDTKSLGPVKGYLMKRGNRVKNWYFVLFCFVFFGNYSTNYNCTIHNIGRDDGVY